MSHIIKRTGIRCIKRRAKKGIQPLRLDRSTTVVDGGKVVQEYERHKDDAKVREGIEHQSCRTDDGTTSADQIQVPTYESS